MCSPVSTRRSFAFVIVSTCSKTSCRIAVEHGRFKMAWIGVAQPSGKKVTPVAWHGDDHGYLEEVAESLRTMPQDPGIAARVLHERNPVVINDIAADPRVVFKAAALKRDFLSCVVMPLIVDRESAGVLTLYSAETGVFDRDEMRLLDDLAGDIGLAMAYIDKEEKLNFLAYYDALTGLCNRSVLVQRLKQEITFAHRRNRRAAVLFIDLDNFKWVNDSLGHSAGDKLLAAVAGATAEARCARKTPSRGSAAMSSSWCSPTRSRATICPRRLERILAAVARPVQLDSRRSRSELQHRRESVSRRRQRRRDADQECRCGDVSRQRAGPQQLPVLRTADECARQRAHRSAKEPQRALEREEFFLHYQPQFSVSAGQVVAAEALARWADAKLGSVPPDRFIPLAEDSGLIVPLGEWILRNACAQMKAWRDAGLGLQRIAVNLSSRQLRAGAFARRVRTS